MLSFPTPKGLEQNEVDRTIASKFRSLVFPRTLEKCFEDEDLPKRRLSLVFGALLGMVAYNSFLFSDWLLSPTTFPSALWTRLALITPIELLATLGIYFARSIFFRELLILTFGALLPAASHLYLTLTGDSGSEGNRHQAVMLVLMFVIMVQRIRFWFAIPACLLSFAMYAWALTQIPDYPTIFVVQSDIVFLTVVAFSLFIAYSLEREYRLSFLLELRGRFQTKILDSISHRDALTGLLNRRSLDEMIEDLNAEAEQAMAVSIILLDIDHFKTFNDTSGHRAGDLCLRNIADVLRSSVTNDTAIYRYGGEEFLIVLPGVELHQALSTAEHLRCSIERVAIRHPGLPSGSIVTASFGVASAITAHGVRAEEIIEAADAALYAAKHAGRNQVWPSPSCVNQKQDNPRQARMKT